MSTASPLSNLRQALNERPATRVDPTPPRPLQPFSTGIPEIDTLTGGGIPRATLTEICGGPSSGRTSLLFSLLAQAGAAGQYLALIDASDSFDPASAVQAGVPLAQLLWIRCAGNAEHALKAVDLIVQAGGFGLVILDLGDIPQSAAQRISLTSWFRLRHAAEHTGATLIALERQFNAQSSSKLQLELAQERSWWSGKRFTGIGVLAKIRKHYRLAATSFRISA